MAAELRVADIIELKDELLISGFLRTINGSSFDIASLIYNLCILYRLGSAQHLWTVDPSTLQQMKNCEIGQSVESPTFEIESLSWQFVAYPNGDYEESLGQGNFDLFAKLVYIPSSWKHVETMSEYVIYTELTKGQLYGWPGNLMLFSEIEPLSFISFSIAITIQRIILKEDDSIFYERNNAETNQSVEWNVDRERLQALKLAHEGKQIWSNLYGGMYGLILTRTDSVVDLGLKVQRMCNCHGRWR